MTSPWVEKLFPQMHAYSNRKYLTGGKKQMKKTALEEEILEDVNR